MAKEIYRAREGAIQWLASGGDHALTLTSLGAGAGRQGALRDFGATTSVARVYMWRLWCKFATAPIVGEVIELYAKTGDGTHRDNDDGAGDAAVSAEDKLLNLDPFGTLVVDEASATPEFSASGLILISAREFAPVIWNRTADALSSTAGDHGFQIVPVPPQRQP